MTGLLRGCAARFSDGRQLVSDDGQSAPVRWHGSIVIGEIRWTSEDPVAPVGFRRSCRLRPFGLETVSGIRDAGTASLASAFDHGLMESRN